MENNANSQKTKPRFGLRSILYNDKLLLVFSLFLSVIVWISITMNVGLDTEKSINTTVKVDTSSNVLQQMGLQAFGETERQVTVNIKAKKYALGDISAEDLVVSANTTNVNSPGNHTLQINVTKARQTSDFEIVSWYPMTIENVYFDTFSTQEKNIEIDVSGEENIVDGFIMGEPVLSHDTATVSGPTTQFNKVERVVARTTLPKDARSNVTVAPDVVALDANGDEVSNINISFGDSALSLTVPILKEATLPLGVNFVNAPAGMTTDNLDITITPSSLKFAAPEAFLNTTTKLNIGDIDFTKLHTGVNTFTFELSKVSGIYILGENKDLTAKVRIDLSGYTTDKFEIAPSAVKFTNVVGGYTASISSSDSLWVTVIGKRDSLREISAADISCVVDMTGVTAEGTTRQKIRFTVKSSDCWVIGEYYVNVKMNK